MKMDAKFKRYTNGQNVSKW